MTAVAEFWVGIEEFSVGDPVANRIGAAEREDYGFIGFV